MFGVKQQKKQKTKSLNNPVHSSTTRDISLYLHHSKSIDDSGSILLEFFCEHVYTETVHTENFVESGMYWVIKGWASRQERHLPVDNLVFSQDIISTLNELSESISDESIAATGSFSIYICRDNKDIMVCLESEASCYECA